MVETIHHLIALFCTVAGKLCHARRITPRYCNEINDLEAVLHIHWAQNPFWMNYLALAVNVNPQQRTEC